MYGDGEFPSGETDIIADDAQLTENWFAREGEGSACGLIWQGEPQQSMDWKRMPALTFDVGELPPNGSASVPACWMSARSGDWKAVRGWWKRLVRPSDPIETTSPVPGRILSIAASPTSALLREQTESVSLRVENRRGKALSARLNLAGAEFQAAPSTLDIEEAHRSRPSELQVQVTCPEKVGAGFITADVETDVITERLKVPIVRISAGGNVDIAQPETDSVVIDNGRLKLHFATRFFGALTALETGGVNHLLSAYPVAKPFVWMNPWFGGVHAFNDWMGDPDLARESFTGTVIEAIGERGWRWRGVRMASDLTHKDRSWLRVELDYLVLPGSNVVALVLRHTNRTDARRILTGGVGVWSQPGGSVADTVVHWERGGELRDRRRGKFGADGESGRWIAIENRNSGDSLVLVAGNPGHNAAWDDFGEEGAHLQARGEIVIGPNATVETLYWLVHTTKRSEAAAYGAALSQVSRLP